VRGETLQKARRARELAERILIELGLRL